MATMPINCMPASIFSRGSSGDSPPFRSLLANPMHLKSQGATQDKPLVCQEPARKCDVVPGLTFKP